MESTTKNDKLSFLQGGGEMGVLTRAFDWSSTPVGTPDTWPTNLRLTVAMILRSKFPMFLWWGDDLIQFYNDAYRPSLGNNGKHPQALGQKGKDCWPEIWDTISPLINQVRITGEATWSEDQLIPIYRNGQLEDVYWTFGYSAITNEDGHTDGVLVVCTETTEAVNARRKMEEAKREVEWQKRLYETITDSTPDLIYVFDLNYRFTYANAALLSMWGKTWEAAIGRGLLENGYEPWHAELHEREIDHVVATKEPVRGEVIFPHAVLGQRVYDYIFVPVLSENGDVEAVAGTTRDITELKLANQSITESEERFRNLADDSPIFVFIVGPDPLAPVNYWNKTWLQYTGQSMEQAVSTAWNGIIHEEDIPLVMKHYTPAFESREPYFIPSIRVKRYDGEYRWHSFKGHPRYLPNGAFNGYVGVGIDIHDQKLTENMLEKSERNLRSMILQSPVAMCILLGPEHIVDIANEAMIELWGKPVEEVMNRPIFEGLPDARQQGLEQLLDNVYRTGETFTASERPVMLWRNGKTDTVYQNFVYEPYKDADGSILGVLVVTTDVTAQVLARLKIEEIVDARTIELKRSNDELAQFAHIASHDLQEPLRKVTTYSQMLQLSLDNISERSQNYLQKIQNSTSRMSALIRDVLSYSQLSQKHIAFTSVDLQAVVDAISIDFELLIEQKRAQIHCRNLPIVEAIPPQMTQLFHNLISNALKFSIADREVIIEIEARELPEHEAQQIQGLNQQFNYYSITVRDNGIGFDQVYAEQIFNIFQRLHGKTAYNGTGIGLAMCKKIALNHHGEIFARSSPGHGATFTIILPEKRS